MRILKVTQTYAPFLEHGGPPVKVRALAEGLARRGHQITVVTADWGMSSRGDLAAVEGSPFGWRRVENGVAAIYLATWLRYRSVTWNPAIKRFCRERLRAFDVVHIYGLYDLLGPRVAAACRGSGLPYVLEPIGMFVPIVRSLWLKRMYHQFPGRRMILGARAVIATAEQEISELISAGIERKRIVLRRNGVEAPPELPPRGTFRRRYGISSNAKLLLFLGRLVSKKNPEVLLRAFASLPPLVGNADLQLVFAGPDEDGMAVRLQNLAGQLGVADRVRCVGPLFNEAKWAAFRDADVFVLPSQNENFGIAAGEAVAAGTPVIVTETCGIAPLLAGQAGLVVPCTEASLADALARLLRDAALHQRLAAGCAAVLPRLSWEEPVAEMESLYASLLPAAAGLGTFAAPGAGR